jgi:hypothetical protein
MSPSPSDVDEPDVFDGPPRVTNADMPEPPHPVNWNLLTAHELEQEWLALNRWVDWLRRTYGLTVAVVPPFWHHHPELVWELSALHLHWLAAYDPEQNASAPLGWHRDFADARERLRYWVTACGTRGPRPPHPASGLARRGAGPRNPGREVHRPGYRVRRVRDRSGPQAPGSRRRVLRQSRRRRGSVDR